MGNEPVQTVNNAFTFTAARMANRVMLRFLKEEPPADLLSIYATVENPSRLRVNRTPDGEEALMESAWINTYLERWGADSIPRRDTRVEWLARVIRYKMTAQFDIDLWEGEERAALVSVADKTESMVRKWRTKRADECMVEWHNADQLTYTGQPLFSKEHLQPDDKKTPFSNILTLGELSTVARVNRAVPTAHELAKELDAAETVLASNRRFEYDLVEHSADGRPLAITVYTAEMMRAFRDLLKLDWIRDPVDDRLVPNRWMGKFRLIESTKGRAGLESTYDVSDVTPGAPRPMVVSPVQELRPIRVNPYDHDSDEVTIGTRGKLVVGPGMPQMVLRVEDPPQEIELFGGGGGGGGSEATLVAPSLAATDAEPEEVPKADAETPKPRRSSRSKKDE